MHTGVACTNTASFNGGTSFFFFFSFTNLARPTGGSMWISISNSATLTGGNCMMMDALMDAWVKKHVGMWAWGISPMGVAEPYAWRSRFWCWRNTWTRYWYCRDPFKKRPPPEKVYKEILWEKKFLKPPIWRHFASKSKSISSTTNSNLSQREDLKEQLKNPHNDSPREKVWLTKEKKTISFPYNLLSNKNNNNNTPTKWSYRKEKTEP